MPANKKYLTASGWKRAGKISAAILGGYLVSMTFHLALATWLSRKEVIITSAYTGFLLWVTLMILAFLAKRAWKVWGIYLLLSAVFAAVAYSGM